MFESGDRWIFTAQSYLRIFGSPRICWWHAEMLMTHCKHWEYIDVGDSVTNAGDKYWWQIGAAGFPFCSNMGNCHQHKAYNCIARGLLEHRYIIYVTNILTLSLSQIERKRGVSHFRKKPMLRIKISSKFEKMNQVQTASNNKINFKRDSNSELPIFSFRANPNKISRKDKNINFQKILTFLRIFWNFDDFCGEFAPWNGI